MLLQHGNKMEVFLTAINTSWIQYRGYLFTYVYIYIYMFIYTYMYLYTYIYTYIYIYLTSIYLYIYCIYTHVYNYMHICVPLFLSASKQNSFDYPFNINPGNFSRFYLMGSGSYYASGPIPSYYRADMGRARAHGTQGPGPRPKAQGPRSCGPWVL